MKWYVFTNKAPADGIYLGTVTARDEMWARHNAQKKYGCMAYKGRDGNWWQHNCDGDFAVFKRKKDGIDYFRYN